MVNSLLTAKDTLAPRPAGITAIALLFGLSGIYLFVIGLLILHSPRLFSQDTIIRIGRPLLTGLEVGGGSYVFLISGWLFVIIGLQLRELRNWASWAATACAMAEVPPMIRTFFIGCLGLPSARNATKKRGQ